MSRKHPDQNPGDGAENGAAPRRKQRRDPLPWHSPRPTIDPFPWRSAPRRRRRAADDGLSIERIDPFSFRTRPGGTDITRFIGGGRRSRRYLAKEQVDGEIDGEAQPGYPEDDYAAPAPAPAYTEAPPVEVPPVRTRRDPYTTGRMNTDITRFIGGNANVTRFVGGRDRSGDSGGYSGERGAAARDRFVTNDDSWSPGENAARARYSLLGF